MRIGCQDCCLRRECPINKQPLQEVKYFRKLLATNPEVNESIRPVLKLSRELIERLQKIDYALVGSLEGDRY